MRNISQLATKKEIEGIELPATIRAIVDEFDAIPVQGVSVDAVKATLTDASETIADGVKGGVKWVRGKIKF